MSDFWSDLPWSKKELMANVYAIIVLMITATIMLFLKSWVLGIVYWIIWLFYIVVGRGVTCRHCDFLGKPCPTWMMGVIGGKLYKRSDKKHFRENAK